MNPTVFPHWGAGGNKIAHRRSLAIFAADSGIAGIPQWESNLSLLIAEKIAVR